MPPKSKAPEEPIPLAAELPPLPVPVQDFLKHVEQNPGVPVRQLLAPFLEYESAIRAYFAQKPDHQFVQGHVNLISLFKGNNADLVKVRARNVAEESKTEKEKYIMSLDDEERKANGDRILVGSLEEFRNNFQIFSEGSLLNLDWSNIIAAGSSVMTPLLKVPEKHAENRKALREYYHQKLAPASDIDLFIYGIEDPEEAIKKMTAVEDTIKNNILWETTTIRTRNTITIVSQYPNRHVQIVLRLYKSPSQILTGFDVPCSCFAYDGQNVLSNPRALAACMTQCNDIDLTRRSPSYENRLSKYSHRGFEVYCAFLDRSKIDPSIYERSFARTIGLARLLVLEALPKPEDRDKYVDKRRDEMGRPPRYINYRWTESKDIKMQVTDEVAEWDFEDVSSYQKFSIPYGPDYNAKRIEKLFFKKDLLLNAEWNPQNQPPSRTVGLHRHPVFFGNVEDVIVDCCGFCPKPLNEEEEKVFEEEEKIFVSGPITFLSDDPGRQEIGSFYPLGPEDYTEMAYVRPTDKVCKAIVDNDVEYIKSWCAQPDVYLNSRDFCGRTLLQLACLSTSTELEIVQILVRAGARLVARMQDGRTALHLAAARGRADIVRVLLEKSAENEHERDEKDEKKRAAGKAKNEQKVDREKDEKMKEGEDPDDGEDDEEGSEESYDNMSDAESTDAPTNTTRGFVKIKTVEPTIDEDDEEDDDIYDINIIDWDNGMSPLHHAIIGGHVDVVEVLASGFGADVLLPVKITTNSHHGRLHSGVILNLALALKLKGTEKKVEMVGALLKLGASCAQANTFDKTSSLHYAVFDGCTQVLDTMFELDGPSAMSVLNNIDNFHQYHGKNATPLITAIKTSDELAKYILDRGALGNITLEEYVHALSRTGTRNHGKTEKKAFGEQLMQPIEFAILLESSCDIISRLITAGADPSTISNSTWKKAGWEEELPISGQTMLNIVRDYIEKCNKFLEKEEEKEKEFQERVLFGQEVLDAFEGESYQRFCAEHQLRVVNEARKKQNKTKLKKKDEGRVIALQKQRTAVEKVMEHLKAVEKTLVDTGAKTFYELFPDKLVLKQRADEERAKMQATQHTQWSPDPLEEEETQEDDIFTVKHNFNVPYLGEGNIQEGYLRLFEAIWRGTLEDAKLVKRLTLGPTNEGGIKIPALRISVADQQGCTALWLALYRKNWDMARLILNIVQEQWMEQAESNEEKRYLLRARNRDSDVDTDDSDDGIEETVFNTAFTIENIGVKRDLVKTHISPYAFLSQGSQLHVLLGAEFRPLRKKFPHLEHSDWTPLGYAIYKNDMELFRFILSLAAELKEDGVFEYLGIDKDLSRAVHVQIHHLRLALILGRIEIIEEIMKTTPFGIPWAELEEADEEIQMQKPKYYQGLTVYGTKRKDWASSSYPAHGKTSDQQQKPAQIAVYYGQLDSIKWLLSDRPFQCLQEFINARPDTMRSKLLKRQGDGLGFLLQKGLGVETTLLPHLAIKGWSKTYPMETFHFLLSRPGAIEARTNLSMNLPLYAIQEAGLREDNLIVVEELRKPEHEADFTARDCRGRNAVHHALVQANRRIDDVKHLQALLNLLPETMLEIGWTQRMLGTSQTPLAYWLATQHDRISIPALRLILKYSKGRELGIANSEGNLPIHWAYQNGYSGVARILTEMAPQYIHTENANGRTPTEIATSRYLFDIWQNVPSLLSNHSIVSREWVFDQPLSKFYPPKKEENPWPPKLVILEDRADMMEVDGQEAEKEEEPEDGVDWEWDNWDVKAMYQVALQAESKFWGKRKLVSLADANELAKRITIDLDRKTDEFDGGDILSFW